MLGFADSVFQGYLILSFLLKEHIAVAYVNLCTLFQFSPSLSVIHTDSMSQAVLFQNFSISLEI